MKVCRQQSPQQSRRKRDQEHLQCRAVNLILHRLVIWLAVGKFTLIGMCTATVLVYIYFSPPSRRIPEEVQINPQHCFIKGKDDFHLSDKRCLSPSSDGLHHFCCQVPKPPNKDGGRLMLRSFHRNDWCVHSDSDTSLRDCLNLLVK